MQAKRKQITGDGPPGKLQAPLGERYRDQTSGRRWIMGPNGWEMAVTLQADVISSDKGHWINAAREEQMPLDQWVSKTLNEAAAKYPLPTKEI